MMRRMVLAVLLGLSLQAAHASERLELSWATLGANGWQLSDAALVLDWSQAGRMQLQFTAARASFADQQFEKLQLQCPQFDLQLTRIACRQGRFSLSGDGIAAKAVPAGFDYQFGSGLLSVELRDIDLAQGRVNLQLELTPQRWRLDAELAGTQLAGLAALLTKAGVQLKGLTLQGGIAGQLSLQAAATAVQRVSWKLRTENVAYSNASGTQAGEALQLVSAGSATRDAGNWRIDATLGGRQGMLYAEPVYLEFEPARPLELSLQSDWVGGERTLVVRSLAFSQPGVVDGRLRGELALAAEQPLRKLDLSIDRGVFPGLYSNWLQPWLAGTALGDLETQGGLQARLRMLDGAPQALQLDFDQVSLQARNTQFGIGKLRGSLQWDNSAQTHTSSLSWEDASVYRLQFGAAQLALETGARHVSLQQPLVVPLFDGALHIDTFALEMAKQHTNWSVDAFLTPVSMQRISSALEWPPFAGKLSGMVPKVRYREGELSLGGVLLVQAFDGAITLRNLRVQDPLGLAPRLWADAGIEQLDLKTLTRAFSFGRIEGRLQGRVKDLYMEAWQPVAFDAVFETPPDDDSRHRISQRAVDNISDLGGAGMAGALSRSFLRFLEDFPYKRLGIRCRLSNGICHMGGVAPAPSGYYLVQGRLIPPRLDVIGFAEEVDWVSLLDRLKAITEGDLPEVR